MENSQISKDAAVVSNFKSTSLKWGLIGGGVVILYTVLMYIVDYYLMINGWASFVGYLMLIVVLVIGVKEVRSNQGGYISLSEALFSAFLIYIIATVLNTIFSYILFNWIDPNLPVLLKEQSIYNAVEKMRNMGESEEEINKKLEMLDGLINISSVKMMSLKFIIDSALSFIACFIIALIMKKKRAIFE